MRSIIRDKCCLIHAIINCTITRKLNCKQQIIPISWASLTDIHDECSRVHLTSQSVNHSQDGKRLVKWISLSGTTPSTQLSKWLHKELSNTLRWHIRRGIGSMASVQWNPSTQIVTECSESATTATSQHAYLFGLVTITFVTLHYVPLNITLPRGPPIVSRHGKASLTRTNMTSNLCSMYLT